MFARVLACLLLVVSSVALAQDANTTGRVSGALRDDAGVPLPGVKIRFKRLDDPKGRSPEVTTNKKGEFVIGFFPMGAYRPELVSDELYVVKLQSKSRGADGNALPGVDDGSRGQGNDSPFGTPPPSGGEPGRPKPQGGAPAAGASYFEVQMGSVTDLALTAAHGKPAPVATGGNSVEGDALRAAHDALEKGDFETVLAATDRALKVNPESGMAVLLRGVAFARQSKFDEAVPLLRRAATLLPDPKIARAMLATALLAQADALSAADKAAEAKPLYGEAADLLVEQAQAPGADTSLLGNAVYALSRAGRDADALAMTKKLADASPGDLTAQLRYADALTRAGRKDDALAVLKALKPAAGDTLGTLRVAEMLTNAGDYESALQLLAPVPMDSRDAAAVLYNAAVGLINAGKAERVLPELERAAAGQPNLAFLHHTLGFVYLSQNRNADAARELETSIKLEPDGPNAATDKSILDKLKATKPATTKPAAAKPASPKKP